MKALHGPDYQPSRQEIQNEIRDITLVISRLTRESNMTVFITDTFERSEAEHEGNETGVLMTPTLAGLEKFVDLVVETSVEADLQPRYWSSVVKSNLTDVFPLGARFENATARLYFERYRAARAADSAALAVAEDLPAPVAAPSLDDLRAYYQQHGFSEAALVNGAKRHCAGRGLAQLTDDDRRLLIQRLDEYLAAQTPEPAAAPAAPATRATVVAASSRSRRAA
jgi:hypothetical protein